MSATLIPDFTVPARPIVDDVSPETPRLRSVDARVAEAQTQALSALNGVVFDGLYVSVRPDQGQASIDWIILATTRGLVHVAPVTVGGRDAPSSRDDEDDVAILAAASDLEPLFLALEHAGVADMDPMGVAREPAADGVHLWLEARDTSDRIVHAVRLILDESVALALAVASDPVETLDLPVRVRIELEGPSLCFADVDALSIGDLVLLPRSDRDGWSTKLRADGARAISIGRLDLGLSLFTHQRKETLMVDLMDRSPVDVAADSDLVPPGDMAIAVSVSLGEATIPLNRLKSLQPGMTLALPDIGADMAVTLSSAGQAFARGRLVSLGQTYGVIIDVISAQG